jgi:hypothetical protein
MTGDYDKMAKNKTGMMSRLVKMVVLLEELERCGAEKLTS